MICVEGREVAGAGRFSVVGAARGVDDELSFRGRFAGRLSISSTGWWIERSSFSSGLDFRFAVRFALSL